MSGAVWLKFSPWLSFKVNCNSQLIHYTPIDPFLPSFLRSSLPFVEPACLPYLLSPVPSLFPPSPSFLSVACLLPRCLPAPSLPSLFPSILSSFLPSTRPSILPSFFPIVDIHVHRFILFSLLPASPCLFTASACWTSSKNIARCRALHSSMIHIMHTILKLMER